MTGAADLRLPPPVAPPVRPPQPLATEHEARGLQNLVALLSHCLLKTVATDEEKRRWSCEVEEAKQRLGQLRVSGVRPEL